MLSFKTFLTEKLWASSSPKIIYLNADSKTQQNMRNWCEAQGFDLTKSYSGRTIQPYDFNFHVTVVASKNNVFVPKTQHMIKPFSLKPVGFEALGPDKNIPVLRLEESEQLGNIRRFFIESILKESYGIIPTFEKFKPHISLSYNWNKKKPKLERLQVPSFPIVVNEMVIQDFNP